MAYPYLWGIVEGKRASIRCQDTGAREVVLGSDNFAFVGGSISNLDELTELVGVRDGQRPEDLVSALYRKRGRDGFSLLKGDFIIVYWHGEEQALTLVRDKFGIHNVYYVLTNGTFAFSTSLTQLVNAGLVGKEVDLSSLYSFFSLGVILPPRTVYKHVSSVEPGQCLRYQGGKLEKRYYFNLELPGEKISDRTWLVAECQQVLREAVRRACENTNKVGVYLSGGVDSAVILSLAKQEAQGKEVSAFTMGPWGETSSDLKYARFSASFSGVPQMEWHAGVKDLNYLPHIVALTEQPNSDSAAMAYYLLAEEAKKYGFDVMLSGQNADTVMGAMPYVKFIYWSDRWQHYVPYGLSWMLMKLSPLLLKAVLRNRLSFLMTPEHCAAKLLYFKTKSFYRYKDTLFSFQPQINETQVFRSLYDSVDAVAKSNIVDRIVYLDEKFTEAPRCLEAMQKPADKVMVKLPFYDQDVVDFALKIPDKIRAEKDWDKMVLRDAARSLVHPEIYQKYKKSLVFPTHQWFRETLYERLLRYFAASDFLNEFINMKQLLTIFNQRLFDYGDIIYRVLVLAVWYNINIEGGFEVTKDTSLEEVLDFDLLGSQKD